jgi:cysteine-rich repeat protein
MAWLRVSLISLVATAIGCGAGALDPGNHDAGVGRGGAGGSVSGGYDARPDIPTIITVDPQPCGNGKLDPGEQCDDANKVQGDGCSAICQIECFESCGSCGTGGPCVITPPCGNGWLDMGEACDDANNVAGDGCAADCSAIEPGWRCPAMGRRCAPICGDGRIVFPETCDDSNTIAGDGCGATCVLEPSADLCGDGVVEGAEECDDGSGNSDFSYNGCAKTCRWGDRCGDGVINENEECDFGSEQNRGRYGDLTGCTPICTYPHFCGDGFPDAENGEQCDLGANNGQPQQPCTTTCKICIDCV